MRLAQRADEILEAFRAVDFRGAPLRAFADENDVDPPCVFLAMPGIEFRYGKNCADLTWTAYLIGPNADASTSGAALSDLVDAIVGVFPFDEGRDWLLTLPGGGTQTRAYQVTWLDKITIGD